MAILVISFTFRLALLLLAPLAGLIAVAGADTNFPQPPRLTFRDLVALAADDPPPAGLQTKLDAVLETPIVSNGIGNRGDSRGPIGMAEWNIDKGYNEPEILQAFADPEGFGKRMHLSPRARRQVTDEARQLNSADIIVLDEVDLGDGRTKYRNVAADIARAMRMNYAFGVEFIELNRIYLGVRHLDIGAPAAKPAEGEMFGLDPKRYRGLEGSAVLSRFPILSAEVVRLPAKYDWYHSEADAISRLEHARRWTAKKLFDEQIRRQVRRGGRLALLVRLKVPDSPTGAITVIAPHLENYTTAAGRREQMHYLLNRIRTIRDPVVMAGDLNSFNQNGTPLTIKRALLRYLGDYHFWARQLAFALIPVPGLSYMVYPVNHFKNWHDPTAFSLPVFFRNQSGAMFNDIQQFRFADGGVFDFAGNPASSYRHRARTLSDSSERAWKGFTPTFSFQRTWHGLIGVYKIDWFFAKTFQWESVAAGKNTPGEGAPAGFRPYDGRTFGRLNTALAQRISDHAPTMLKLHLGGQAAQPNEITESTGAPRKTPGAAKARRRKRQL